MDLHTAGHRRGVVAAPHHAAVEAGRAALAEGGNALEAMVAMAATIAVVYPHMTQLGGDGFWLVREPSGRVRALMAAGRAGANARRELYRDYEMIPPRGALAALTVPGAVAGWMLALEAASAYGGRLRLGDLLAPAIAHAREGTIVTRSQARFTAEKLAELEDVPGFAPTFLLDGKPPEAGATLKQAALAATLDHLAHAGLDDFYRGDVGREIAGDLDRVGSPVTRADLERCRATLAEPLSVALDAGRAFNTPPPTQGLASLIILALFERLRVPQGEGFDHIHTLVEATKRAFGVRDRSPQGGALARARRRGRHGLDGRRRRLGPRRLLRPVALLGIRLRHGAAPDRRADAESGREFFARKRRVECPPARPTAAPYAQSGARRARRRPHPRLWRHGRGRSAADASGDIHAARALPDAGGARDRRPALAVGPHLGLDAGQSAHGSALRWRARRPPDVGRARRRNAGGALFGRHGPCRRGGAASGWNVRRRS